MQNSTIEKLNAKKSLIFHICVSRNLIYLDSKVHKLSRFDANTCLGLHIRRCHTFDDNIKFNYDTSKYKIPSQCSICNYFDCPWAIGLHLFSSIFLWKCFLSYQDASDL